MRIKALQDRCVANEVVICQFCKRQEIENKEWDQYKEVIHILNKDLIDTQAKPKEESRLREEAEKVRTNLTTELAALSRQMDKTKIDAVVKF